MKRRKRAPRRTPYTYEVAKCDCCDAEWRVTSENLAKVQRLMAAQGKSTLNISEIPPGPDWMRDVTDEDVAALVAAAASP